jgi:hypothetical protein
LRLAGAALVGLLLGHMAPLTYAVVTRPEQATLPRDLHEQYVEGRVAGYGLGRMASYLRDQAARYGLITVLVPPPSEPSHFTLIPQGALRLYLRDEPGIEYRESRELWPIRSLCGLRPWLSSERPTFFASMKSYVAELSVLVPPPSVEARATRALEAALARDLPEADRVLRVPRLGAPYAFDLYRLSEPGGRREASAASQVPNPCLVPEGSFGTGWQPVGQARRNAVQTYWVRESARFREGPLPAGWYRPSFWARPAPAGATVAVKLNAMELGRVVIPPTTRWTWLESPAAGWVTEAGFAELSLQVERSAAGGVEAGSGLEVAEIVLTRQTGAMSAEGIAPNAVTQPSSARKARALAGAEPWTR